MEILDDYAIRFAIKAITDHDMTTGDTITIPESIAQITTTDRHIVTSVNPDIAVILWSPGVIVRRRLIANQIQVPRQVSTPSSINQLKPNTAWIIYPLAVGVVD